MSEEIAYDSTVDTKMHIAMVQKNLKKIATPLFNRCTALSANSTILKHLGYLLNVRGLEHDKSKLEDIEKETFDRVTPKLKGLTYGSPEFDRCKSEMGPALDHHYASNKHHPEHFENGMLGMTLVDLIECFCDWAASTERHGDGDIHKSIEINKKRFAYDEVLACVMHNTARGLKMGRNCGDDPIQKINPAKFLYTDHEEGVSGMVFTTLVEQFSEWVRIARSERGDDEANLLATIESSNCGPILHSIFMNTFSEYNF